MPATLDDPYSGLPDTSKTGTPHRSSAAEDGDPYAAMGDAPSLPAGVAIIGRNSTGGPIYGVSEPKLAGGKARRFLQSAWEQVKQPVAGMYHAMIEGPQNPEEARIEALGGPASLRVKRLLIDPHSSGRPRRCRCTRHPSSFTIVN
jgi:hypothetical protein